MEDKQLGAAESLALISRMIDNTRNRMVRNSGRPFLIWGYTTIAVAAAVWIAVGMTQNYQWHYLWYALPAIGSLLMYLTRRRDNGEGEVRTYIDRTINTIWGVAGFAAVYASIFAFFRLIPILFVILLLMGVASAITCFLIRFRVGVAGGIAGILLAPVAIIAGPEWSMAVFIAGFAVMMVIPGHALNQQSKRIGK